MIDYHETRELEWHVTLHSITAARPAMARTRMVATGVDPVQVTHTCATAMSASSILPSVLPSAPALQDSKWHLTFVTVVKYSIIPSQYDAATSASWSR